GRIGDSPIIGAGTWAGSGCAVSATGTGEYFIRNAVARTLCMRVAWVGEDVRTAADGVINDVGAIGGDGGVIALTADGRVAFSMNTSGMYRGWASSESEPVVAIYADED